MHSNVTKPKIQAIKNLIASSQLIGNKTREVCLFLLDYIERNNKTVSITIGVSESFSTKHLDLMVEQFDAICDGNKATKVNQMMEKLGMPLMFMYAEGAYADKTFEVSPKVGEFANIKVYTFFLCEPKKKKDAVHVIDSCLHEFVLMGSIEGALS